MKRNQTYHQTFFVNVKKNVPWHILAPSAVACDMFLLRASAHHWHVSAFLCNREFKEFPITQKDCQIQSFSLWTAAFSFLQNQLLSSIPYVLFSCFSTFLTYPSTVSALNASSFGVKRTVNAIDFLSAAICLPSYTSNRLTSLT